MFKNIVANQVDSRWTGATDDWSFSIEMSDTYVSPFTLSLQTQTLRRRSD